MCITNARLIMPKGNLAASCEVITRRKPGERNNAEYADMITPAYPLVEERD